MTRKVQHMYKEVVEHDKHLPFHRSCDTRVLLTPDHAVISPGTNLQSAADTINAARIAAGLQPLPVLPPARLAAMNRPNTIILIGNAWNNSAIFDLYRQSLCFLDSEYPGPAGYTIHTLHDPFGDRTNYLLLGGSDLDGARAAASVFARNYAAAELLDARLSEVQGPYRLNRIDSAVLKEMAANHTEQITNGYSHGAMRQVGIFGLISYLSGNRDLLPLMRDSLLLYETLARSGRGWAVDSNTLLYFWSYPLVLAWQLVAHDPCFSDADRHRIDTMCYNLTDWMVQLEHFRKPGCDTCQANHRTFAMLSFYLCASFMKRHYHIAEYDDQLALIPKMLDLHQRSWKILDNGGATYGWLTPNHLLRFAGLTDNWNWFGPRPPSSPDADGASVSNVRKLCDYGIIVTNNLGKLSPFGDEVGYDFPWRRPGHGGIFAAAAWYYRDGRYQWARDYVMPRDNVVKACLANWASFDAFPDYGSYAADIPPVVPSDLTGLAVARPDDDAVEHIKQVKGVQRFAVDRSEMFDKLSLRPDFSPESEYLLLEGCTGYYHTHEDINSIIGFTWKNRVFLNELGYPRREARYHNSVVIFKDGQIVPKPLVAALEQAHDDGAVALVRSVCRQDNGADWARNIIWRRRRYFIVLDEIEALEDADYQLTCLWRGLGDADACDDSFRIGQSGVTFEILNGDDSRKLLKSEIMGNSLYHGHWTMFPNAAVHESDDRPSIFTPAGGEWAYYPHARGPVKIWCQHQHRHCSPGRKMLFLNLLHCPQDGPIQLERVAETAVKISDDDTLRFSGLAPDGLTLGEIYVQAAGFEIDDQTAHVFACRRFALGDQILLDSPDPVNTVLSFNAHQAVRVRAALQHPQPYPPVRPDLHPTPSPRRMTSRVSVLGSLGAAPRCLSELRAGADALILAGTVNNAAVLLDASGAPRFHRSFDQPILAVKLLDDNSARPLCAVAHGSFLTVLNQRGDIEWQYEFQKIVPGRPPEKVVSFEAIDLTGDGQLHLIAGTSGRQRVYAFTLAGRMLWETEVLHWAVLSLAAGRFDPDAKIVLVANSQYGNARALERDGSWNWAGMFGETAILTAADIDGDGLDEVLAATIWGLHVVKGADASDLWRINLGGQTLKPIVLDHPSHGTPAVLAASEIGELVLADSRGNQLWRRSLNTDLLSLAALKGPKEPLLVAAAAVDGTIHLADAQGNLLGQLHLGRTALLLRQPSSPQSIHFLDTQTGEYCTVPLNALAQ